MPKLKLKCPYCSWVTEREADYPTRADQPYYMLAAHMKHAHYKQYRSLKNALSHEFYFKLEEAKQIAGEE